jgi:zinc transport system permease protein
MSIARVFDPLFLIPFINGLLMALLLSILGCYARIRDEWLASLGLAQASAAGVAVGALVFKPFVVVALAAAGAAAAVKALFKRKGNEIYALMMLGGWSIALLAASNSARGGELGKTLIEGQLYFSGPAQLRGIGILALIACLWMPRLSPRLLLGHFFPFHFSADGPFRPSHDLVFDLLTALSLAFAAMVIGVMGAFAFVFIPPWIAFRVAGGWKRTLIAAALLSSGAYAAAFAAAIAFDQPIGPVLVAVLSLCCLIPRKKKPS